MTEKKDKRGGARENSGPGRSKAEDLKRLIVQESDGGRAYIDALHEIALEDPNATTPQRLRALELLVAWLWGKPAQLAPEAPIKLDVTHRLALSDEELAQLIADADTDADEA